MPWLAVVAKPPRFCIRRITNLGGFLTRTPRYHHEDSGGSGASASSGPSAIGGIFRSVADFVVSAAKFASKHSDVIITASNTLNELSRGSTLPENLPGRSKGGGYGLSYDDGGVRAGETKIGTNPRSGNNLTGVQSRPDLGMQWFILWDPGGIGAVSFPNGNNSVFLINPGIMNQIQALYENLSQAVKS